MNENIDLTEILKEVGIEVGKKEVIDKAYEYAKARYDLDYCGNVRDVLNYLKSLVEE